MVGAGRDIRLEWTQSGIMGKISGVILTRVWRLRLTDLSDRGLVSDSEPRSLMISRYGAAYFDCCKKDKQRACRKDANEALQTNVVWDKAV